ncbi:MAG: sporulation protein YqfC [Bacillota bacterium]|nr:sporulation protein YqfC [Bacillota bacterium]
MPHVKGDVKGDGKGQGRGKVYGQGKVHGQGQGKGGLIRRFAQAFELPGDVVLNLPRVTIVGNALVTVENHRGLVRYDPGSITIGAGGFQIVVEGESMVIGTVEAETITIRGTIARVGFEV